MRNRRPSGNAALVNTSTARRKRLAFQYSRIWMLPCLMVLIGCLGLASAPGHAQTTLVIPDTGGHDQIDQGMGAQQDIAGVSINGNTLDFAWDEPSLSGSNSSDVCSYFQEPDGTVTSVCYSVTFVDPSIPTYLTEYQILDCGTTYGNGKCTGNNPVSTDYAVSCTDPVLVAPYFAPLDPDPDLQAQCTVTGLNGNSADDLQYINTCTKPSASPSSLSNDCIFDPDSDPAFLSLEKEVTDGTADATDFTLTATNSSDASESISGAGSVDTSPVNAGNYSLSESSALIDDGSYQLVEIVCTDSNANDVPVTNDTVDLAPLSTVNCVFTNEVAFVADPAISLDKAGTYNSVTGDIDYTFVVQNTGNVDLSGVSVSDPLVGPVSCPQDTLATDPDGTEPYEGESMTCTASYTPTQAQIDAGVVNNEAEASGNDPDGNPVTDPGDASTPIPAAPGIEIVKDGSLDLGADGIATPGDTINYTFSVQNTGNVTLSNVEVTDALIGSGAICTIATLAPGTTDTSCSASYSITQPDIDAGGVNNQAFVTGDCPDGTADCAEDDDTHEEDIPAAPGIEIVKDGSLDLGADGIATPGDTINYTFSVQNTGNVTLSNVEVTDALIGSGAICTIATLAPGTTDTSCSASYSITQADIDAGGVNNQALVTGDCPDGTTDCAEDDDTHEEDIPQIADIDLTKAGVLDDGGDGIPNVGDSIDYTFNVTNTGNVTLTSVTVDDPLLGGLVCTIAVLAPNAAGSCSASYSLTQADIDNGQVVNSALAEGVPPVGAPPVSDSDGDGNPDDPADAVVVVPQFPMAEVSKSADPVEVDAAGTTINYVVTVTNTGNVTLPAPDPEDTLNGAPLTLAYDSGDNGDEDFDVDETWTFIGSYLVTQEDMDAGIPLANVACVGDVDGDGVDECDDATTTIKQLPAHTFVKDFNPDMVEIGEDGTFTLTYTNTGNVTLSDVEIEDEVATILGVNNVATTAGSCQPASQVIDCTVDSVAPGDSVEVTVTYTAAAGASQTNQTSGASYIFYFENGYVLSGSTATGEATLIDPDGNEVVPSGVSGANQDITFSTPDGQVFNMHLSCSEPFVDGYGITGPTLADNPNWKILSYDVNRYNSQGFLKSCSQAFSPIIVDNTASALATPAGGVLTPNPIEASDSVELIQKSPITVSRKRVRRGNVEIQYFNTSQEDVEISIIGVTWTDGAVLESASYQDGVDLGLSGGSPQSAAISTTLNARSKDWLRLNFDPNGLPDGLTVTIVLTTGETLTYVY